MTREELNTLAADELIEAIQEAKKALPTDYDGGKKQYDPNEHDVKSTVHRPDKVILVPKPGTDDGTGNPIVEQKQTPVAKIALPLQKYIIQQKATFAVGNKITFKPDIQDSPVFEAAWETWRKSKMQYSLLEIAEKLMAETEVALIWYTQKNESEPLKPKFRHRILSPSAGDELYPVFDRYNDMIAFGRGYKINNEDYFDLYTSTDLRRFKATDGKFEEYFATTTKSEDGSEVGILEQLPYGKIPVIYWRQPDGKPECDDVKDLVRAREFNQSDFFDNNQYFGDPILFLKGNAVNMPSKGAPGKTLMGDKDADGKFLTPGDYTAARKLEFDMLDQAIFTLTRSAKLDAESMKGLGDLSAAAMDRILISPHMAARRMQFGEFGKGVQRCMNFLLAVYSNILSIDDRVEAEPQFSLFRIDDAADRVELAMKANGGKPVLDQEESIRMAGVSDYPDETIKRLKEEAQDNIQNAATAMQGNQPQGTEEEEEARLKAS